MTDHQTKAFAVAGEVLEELRPLLGQMQMVVEAQSMPVDLVPLIEKTLALAYLRGVMDGSLDTLSEARQMLERVAAEMREETDA